MAPAFIFITVPRRIDRARKRAYNCEDALIYIRIPRAHTYPYKYKYIDDKGFLAGTRRIH